MEEVPSERGVRGLILRGGDLEGGLEAEALPIPEDEFATVGSGNAAPPLRRPHCTVDRLPLLQAAPCFS